MYSGIKIQNLLRTKDIKQQALATAMGIGAIHLSKKIGQGAKFSKDQISAASTFLGVTTEYLMDESREYHAGDPIPPDAILVPAQPPPVHEPSNPFEQMVRRIAQEIRDETKAAYNPEVLTQELASLKEEIKLMRELMREKLENSADEHDGGSHDPD